MRFMKPLMAALLLGVASFPAQARNVTFDIFFLDTFSTPDPDYGYEQYIVTGSGSFTIPDVTTTIGLGDLTSFSLSGSYVNSYTLANPPGYPFGLSFSFGLADLAAFSGEVAGNSLLSMGLTTNLKDLIYIPGPGVEPGGSIDIPDLSEGYLSATAYGTMVSFDIINIQVTGPESVSEPASMALLLVGAGAMGMAARRRKGAALKL